MEQRLSKVEDHVELLLKNNESIMQFQKSVDASVKKIADAFVEYQKFQVEVEIHRQNDVENITRVEKKVDDLTLGFNDQMHKLHGRIRRMKERIADSDSEFELFKQSVEIHGENREENEKKEKARESKHSDKWWGLFAGSSLAGIGAILSKIFGE